MDEDEDVVLGSETGDHEILFRQEWCAEEDNIRHEPRSNEVALHESPQIDAGAQEEGLRWSLRKRKAIQKMPYSLDRLKHKQLLKGYDISMDVESQRHASRKDRVDTYFHLSDDSDSESDFDDTAEIKDTQDLEGDDEHESESLELPHHIKHKRLFLEVDDEDDDDIDNNDNNDNDTNIDTQQGGEEIVFRGRKVNLNTGYKGVLPKSIWRKTLNNKLGTNQKVRNIKDGKNDDVKGIARRKKAKMYNGSRTLLDDIIEADYNIDSLQETFPSVNNDDQPISNMEEVENYYETKYRNEYRDDELQEDRTLPPESLLGFSKIIYEQEEDTGNGLAKVSDTHTIDSMLERIPRSKSRKLKVQDFNTPVRPSTNKPKAYKRGRKILRINHRSIRRNRQNTRSKPTSSKLAHNITIDKPISTGEIPETAEKTFNEKIDSQTSKKVKKPKFPFGILPPENSVFKKGVKTFTTIVEETGNNIILQRQSSRGMGSYQLVDDDAIIEKASFLSSFPAIQALVYNKIVDVPDHVRITFGDKTFSLSKLQIDDFQRQLLEIFSTIVNIGASDAEIVEANIKITSMLLFHNDPTLFDVVNTFHKEFRAKLMSLSQRSKPIHFMQLIICQLMLFEISKFTSTSKKSREGYCIVIINHIVSFFKLFDICYETIISQPDIYLNESFHILSMIVDELDIKDELWEKLSRNEFSPSVVLILVSIFPTTASRWDIFRLENTFDNLKKAFKVIKFCNTHYKWDYNDMLVIQLSRIYKERRFENFAEESESSSHNHVISSPLARIKKITLFNRYLTVLQETKIGDGLIEKITPMSDILSTDSINILMNRVNLIIILSWFSNLNIEKRLNELLKGLISKEYLVGKDENTVRIISRSILESFLALIRTTAKNNSTISSKTNIFFQFFREYILEKEYLVQLWTSFLVSVRKISDNLPKRNLRNILRLLLNTIVIDEDRKQFSKANIIIMKLCSQHLSYFDTSWIQSRLLSIVERPAKTDKRWIDFYCIICRYLIDKTVITYWAFFQYSGIEKDNVNFLYFVNQAVDIADSEAFQLIRDEIYDTLIGQLYLEKDQSYYNLLSKMLTREGGTKLEFCRSENESHLAQIVKWLIKILAKCNLNKKVNNIIKETTAAYIDERVSRKFCSDVIYFIDTYYRDYLDNYQELSILKRQLNIIDSKDDTTLFKETFRSIEDVKDKLLFIERNVLRALNADIDSVKEKEILKDKLLSLMFSPFLKSKLKFIRILLESNVFLEEATELVAKSQTVVKYLIDILISYIYKRSWMLEADERIEIYELFKYLLLCFPKRKCIISGLFSSIFTITEEYLDDVLYGNSLYMELASLFKKSFDTESPMQIIQTHLRYDFAKLVRESVFPVTLIYHEETINLDKKIKTYLDKHKMVVE